MCRAICALSVTERYVHAAASADMCSPGVAYAVFSCDDFAAAAAGFMLIFSCCFGLPPAGDDKEREEQAN